MKSPEADDSVSCHILKDKTENVSHHYDVAITLIVKLQVCQKFDSSFSNFGLHTFSSGLHTLVGLHA